jgi:diguanylate cyclase (GGDEF)-like protein
VESPFSCAAVRRGSAVVFDSSESLNACPKLRGRPGGACSAACVPVGFMGRALGVLHVTAPEHAPPDALAVEQLTVLATQAGARIGTVRAFEKSQLQAATDGLTGLANRRTTQTQLRGLIKAGRGFAIAFADLDEFKQLNDKHGHEAGDRALRLFAQVCQSVLREHDVVARWGGEEFLIVLPDLDRQSALAVLERIRERLAEGHAGNHPRFTASFGLTDSTEAESLEELLMIADAALYDAKAAGRDRIKVGAPLVNATLSGAEPEGAAGRATPKQGAGRRPPALHTAAEEEDPIGVDVR